MKKRAAPAGSSPLLSRRRVLRHGAQGLGALGLSLFGSAVAVPVARAGGADDFGPLLPADGNGLRLPLGFSSRIVAETGVLVPNTAQTPHVWHGAPDGGATFSTEDGGWVYVSNAELGSGGAGALRFTADGTIADAYTILSGTSINCAGGPTPWDTWLSCEEVPAGRVYECNPMAASQGVPVPTLGTFKHEAAAVDSVHSKVYLTEDRVNGRLYRFSPTSYPSLEFGTLEVAETLDPNGLGDIMPGEVRTLAWHPLLDPNPVGGGINDPFHQPADERATRFQVPASTEFNGGEGCWYKGLRVYFSTKGDGRIWEIDTRTDQISIYYDQATNPSPLLTGVDNVYVATNRDVYVAEDPGNMEIVALTPSGGVHPIVQITGVTGSEVTGPALSPDGTRLYFSSQRNPGMTYEVTGPFAPRGEGVPALGGWGVVVLAGALVAAARLRGAWRAGG